MLHPVPNSQHREILLRVVELQQLLTVALCGMPEGATLDLELLQTLWEECDEMWVRRFWENDGGKRAEWIGTLAAASPADKQLVRNMLEQQTRFLELYDTPPTIRLSEQDWENETLVTLRKLLKSFYAPYFYANEGYGAPCEVEGQTFTKDVFLAGFPEGGPKVCPYCDNFIKKPELDHFLPQDEFPVLSCHPDNLFPSCHDCNSITQKGAKVPLSFQDADQTLNWFHPRRRSASEKIRVTFREDTEHQLQMRLAPVDPSDAQRVDKLDWLFGLTAFWGKHTNPDIQMIGTEVSGLLQSDGVRASLDTIRHKLAALALLERERIGKRGLAIPQSGLYVFVASNEALVAEIARQCAEDSAPNNA
jgi:hypothetical protein